MFSAVYLVCILNQPCQYFVDSVPYPTLFSCQDEALATIQENQDRVLRLEAPEHTAEFQCISWEKA